MSTEVNAIVNEHGAPTEEQRERRTKTGVRRGRSALLTVPIVIVGTLAISLNLAAPAHAVVAKKPLNPKLVENPVRVATVSAAAVEAPPAQYSVAQGDTVSGIAARFGLSTPTVLSLNGLDSSALIFPGQVLMLSGAAATAGVSFAAYVRRALTERGVVAAAPTDRDTMNLAAESTVTAAPRSVGARPFQPDFKKPAAVKPGRR